jgi:hypothetical protein
LSEVVSDFSPGTDDRDMRGNENPAGGWPIRNLVLLHPEFADSGRG